ncbi:undecaprenyl-phosphate glucose phosphotransferase [Sphingobium lactosutens]|uniref:undecaprenyl-phosphate glucose phosphotransferase n=1 Tax=Sphingobium lactosutens TaxID=522773 RepID=UPI0015BAA3AF|nr:undecaprenyl-phosphate glucose phosphotransferase [Sphingobium lactosutens]NWK95849.1 undecaprenyl-phosphate glucose phosphotransferase [Sphingobium lactosutens]
MPDPDKKAGGVMPRSGQVPLGIFPPLMQICDFAALNIAVLFLSANEDAMVLGSSPIVSSHLGLICGTVFVIVGQLTGAYESSLLFSVRRSWSRLFNAWLGTTLLLLSLGFLLRLMTSASRGSIFLWFIVGLAMLALLRLLLVTIARSLKRQGRFDRRCAIYGAGGQGQDLARYIINHDKLTLSLTGFYDDRRQDRLDERLPIPLLGGIDDLLAAIRKDEIDQVIIALPWAADARLRQVVGALAVTPVQIRLAPEKAGFAFARMPVMLLGGLPVMTLLEKPMHGSRIIEKWAEDRTLSFLLLILLSPLFLLIALAIKMESRGPVFFVQRREGFNCRDFRIFKFRSMYVDLCQTDEIVQASKRDPRVTRVGAILRKTSLDELPQLLNVLLGEMSLVGPRPHAPSTRAGGRLFNEVLSSYVARHKVKPGLTGWAQVCGWRGETDTEDKLIKRIEHDLYYIENWSIWFDLYILLRTISAVLGGQRAY